MPTEHILNQLLEVWRLYVLICIDKLTSLVPTETLANYETSLALSKFMETEKPNPSYGDVKT